MFLATYGRLISWPDFGLLFGLCRSEQEQHKLKAVSMASFLMRRNHFDIRIPTADVLTFPAVSGLLFMGPEDEISPSQMAAKVGHNAPFHHTRETLFSCVFYAIYENNSNVPR
jgi:hypothetical protein